jgi:hypothetical protein
VFEKDGSEMDPSSFVVVRVVFTSQGCSWKQINMWFINKRRRASKSEKPLDSTTKGTRTWSVGEAANMTADCFGATTPDGSATSGCTSPTRSMNSVSDLSSDSVSTRARDSLDHRIEGSHDWTAHQDDSPAVLRMRNRDCDDDDRDEAFWAQGEVAFDRLYLEHHSLDACFGVMGKARRALEWRYLPDHLIVGCYSR